MLFPPLLQIKFFIAIIAPLWPKIIVIIAFSGQQSNTNPSSLPVSDSPSCSYSEATKQSTPKSHHLSSLIKNHKHKKIEEHPYSVITTAKSTDRTRLSGHSLSLVPIIGNPISPHQSQTQIHREQAQRPHLNTQILLPYSGFLPNTTLSPPVLIPAPPRAPQLELLIFSNTPQFFTQPISFANTDKTHSSELSQPVHSVSNINDTTRDITLFSDTSISHPTNSQISSPTPSQIASNPFNPSQGSKTNF